MADVALEYDPAWGEQWSIREDTIYLNHGSFGPPPRAVREARRHWIDRLDSQPMDFFVRQHENALANVRDELARFVGCGTDDLVFVDNATMGMNIVAYSFPLKRGDQVLLTDHEYGAVERIWDRACEAAGARRVTAHLPMRFESKEEVVEQIFRGVTERTRLIVVSHITSPTAVILPVKEICEQARQRDIRVCIDGPHAIAMLPLQLRELDCDFYTASCHKWLSASFGSGFMYAHPRVQDDIQPPVLSWGRLQPNPIEKWRDEFTWLGTHDPSAVLSIGAAIGFLQRVGLNTFREYSHAMAKHARDLIVELTGRPAYVEDSPDWYGSMIALPLPPGDTNSLQQQLWREYGIEVPIVAWGDDRHIRTSFHLYNTPDDVQTLLNALSALLARGR